MPTRSPFAFATLSLRRRMTRSRSMTLRVMTHRRRRRRHRQNQAQQAQHQKTSRSAARRARKNHSVFPQGRSFRNCTVEAMQRQNVLNETKARPWPKTLLPSLSSANLRRLLPYRRNPMYPSRYPRHVVLAAIATNISLRPTGAPREAIASHEVTAPRAAGPSGRTVFQWPRRKNAGISNSSVSGVSTAWV